MFKSKYEKISDEEKQIKEDALKGLTTVLPDVAKAPENSGELVSVDIEEIDENIVEISYTFASKATLSLVYQWDGSVWNYYDSYEEDDSFSFDDIDEEN